MQIKGITIRWTFQKKTRFIIKTQTIIKEDNMMYSELRIDRSLSFVFCFIIAYFSV